MTSPAPSIPIPSAPTVVKMDHGYVEYAEYVAFEESKAARRKRVCCWSVVAVTLLLAVGVAVGVTLGLLLTKSGTAAEGPEVLPEEAGAGPTNTTAAKTTSANGFGLPGVAFPLPKFIKVLALGDSLTAGQHGSPIQYSPYGVTLLENLQHDTRLAGIKVEVDIQGYSGDLINGGFPKRLRERLEEADKQSYLYTHAVILGGVNDINLNRSEPEHVFRGLQSLYDTTLTQSPTTQVIACTIMENMYKNNESDFTQRDEARKEVNRLLRAVYVDNKVQGISLLDLEKLLPYDGLSEWEKFVYYDDKLHLSIVGYERLGNLVYDHIIRQLASSESK